MHTQTETIEIEAESLDQAKAKISQQVPEGWIIVGQKVVHDGSPQPRVTRTVEIEANSPEEAREKVKSQLANELVVLGQKTIADGKPEAKQVTAGSAELALVNIMKTIPTGATILENKVLIPAQHKTIKIEAVDSGEATNKADQEARNLGHNTVVKNVKQIVTGKKGFFGIGREPNQYEAELFTPATIEVTYKQQARICFELGAYESANAKIRVDIVPPTKRTKAPVNWDEFTTDMGKQELRGRVLPVQVLLCCQNNQTATRLSAGYPKVLDRVLMESPEIIEFPNGQAAVRFLLAGDNFIIGFMETIGQGSYGTERLAIKGGVAVGLRTQDRYPLLSALHIQQFGMLGPVVGKETFVWW